MDKKDIEEAMVLLTNDTSVPPWAKLLIYCIRNFLVNRSESAGLLERVEKLEIVTKTEMDELKTENRYMKIQLVFGASETLQNRPAYS